MKKAIFGLLAVILSVTGLVGLSAKVAPIKASITIAGPDCSVGNGTRG